MGVILFAYHFQSKAGADCKPDAIEETNKENQGDTPSFAQFNSHYSTQSQCLEVRMSLW